MWRVGGIGLVLGVAAARVASPQVPRIAPVAHAGARQPSVAFLHVNVIPMDTDRVLTNQTVVVQEGRITAFGPASQVRVPRGSTRIDGRGKFLLPGLGDMHTHLAFSGTAHAERHMLLLLAAGVTTVRNMDYFPNSVSHGDYQPFKTSTRLDGPGLLRLRARVAAGELLGPRIYTSASWRTDTTKSIDQNVAAYKAAGYDHIKWYGEDSVTTDSLAAAAHRLGVPLVGHGLEPPSGGLARTLAMGLTSIEHMVPYTNDSTLAAQVAGTVRAGVWNCIGPLFLEADPSPLERRYARAELRALRGSGPDTSEVAGLTTPLAGPLRPLDSLLDVGVVLRALHAGGAKLLLGTDTPVWGILPTTLNRSIQNAVQLGLTPYEALALVTRNVAEYFGTLDSVGTVAVGKRADLVLLAGNPLDDIRHVHDIVGVVVGGRWLSEAELRRRLDALYKVTSTFGR